MNRKTGILLVVLALLLATLFAGCGEAGDILQEHVFHETSGTTEPTEPPTETVPMNTAPMEFLMLLYPNDHTVTAVDYELLDFFQGDDGNFYKVVWTTDVSEDVVQIVPNDDGTVTVDINELCPQDTPYTLTASIATAEGYRLTHNWHHTVPQAADMVAIVEKAYALNNGQRLPGMYTLTGTVTSIEKEWSEDYQNITVTIRVQGCENMPIRCYCLTGNGAENVKIGDVITVTGSLQNYSNRIEFDLGCKLDMPTPTEPDTESPTE